MVFFWENVFQKCLQEPEMVEALQDFLDELKSKEVMIYFLTNLRTSDLVQMLEEVDCQEHVTYDCNAIIEERERANKAIKNAKKNAQDKVNDDDYDDIDDEDEDENSSNRDEILGIGGVTEDDDLNLSMRIIGVDSHIRQKDGMSLQTILMKLMDVTKCQHDSFLYVDCHKAILAHLIQMHLCRTFQIAKKGLIVQKEIADILAMS